MTALSEERLIPVAKKWREYYEAGRTASRELDKLLNEASKRLNLDKVDVAFVLLEKLKRVVGR